MPTVPVHYTLIDPGAQSNLPGDTVAVTVAQPSSVGDPDTLTVTGLPAGLQLTSDGMVTGTIASAANSGAYSVTIVAFDLTTNTTASENFAWQVNGSPASVTLSNPGAQSNFDGDVVNLPLSASDSANNTLTFAASGLPSGLSIGSTGVISGTIASNADVGGPYAVTVTATDGTANASASQTFNWAVTNPVTLTSPGDQSNFDGDAVSLGVSGSDAAGNALIFSASGLPAGLTIDSGSGTISGTIPNNAASTTPFVVTVTGTDAGANVSASVTFDWTVNPPVVTLPNPGDLSNQSGDGVYTSVSGSSTDGYALTYAETGLPPGLSIDNNSGVISGTIPNEFSSGGLYVVTVTGTDTSSGISANVTFNWGVDTYPAYLAAVAQADQLYSAAVLGAVGDRQAAIDSGRLSATASADQAYTSYETTVSTAEATYVTNFMAAVGAYQGVVDGADSVAGSAYSQTDSTYDTASQSAQGTYDTAVASDTQVYQTAMDAADATYSSSVAPYQIARDNAYAYYQANPNDSAAQQAFSDADSALNSAIQGASAIQVSAQAGANTLYQAALAADSQTLANANAAALTTLQASETAADSAWSAVESPAWTVFTATKSTSDATLIQAESDAWSSYLTTLTNLESSVVANEAIIQSQFVSTVNAALSTWQGSEQTAWNSYLTNLTSLASMSPAPQQQARIMAPVAVTIPPVTPFPGLAAQPRVDVNNFCQAVGDPTNTARAMSIGVRAGQTLERYQQIRVAGNAWLGAQRRLNGQISSPADSLTLTISIISWAPPPVFVVWANATATIAFKKEGNRLWALIPVFDSSGAATAAVWQDLGDATGR